MGHSVYASVNKSHMSPILLHGYNGGSNSCATLVHPHTSFLHYPRRPCALQVPHSNPVHHQCYARANFQCNAVVILMQCPCKTLRNASATYVQSAAITEASSAVQACQTPAACHSQTSATQHRLCQGRFQKQQAAALTALKASQIQQPLLRFRPQQGLAAACSTIVQSAGALNALHA